MLYSICKHTCTSQSYFTLRMKQLWQLAMGRPWEYGKDNMSSLSYRVFMKYYCYCHILSSGHLYAVLHTIAKHSSGVWILVLQY